MKLTAVGDVVMASLSKACKSASIASDFGGSSVENLIRLFEGEEEEEEDDMLLLDVFVLFSNC